MVNVARPALSPPPSLPVQAKKCENIFAIVLTGNFASESQQLAATFQAGETVLVRLPFRRSWTNDYFAVVW